MRAFALPAFFALALAGGPAFSEGAARPQAAKESSKAAAERIFHPLLAPSSPENKALKARRARKNESYSFRPLLIQGQKRLSSRSKDMRVEGESIVESEMFLPQIDFRGRIFEMQPEGGQAAFGRAAETGRLNSHRMIAKEPQTERAFKRGEAKK